MMEYFLEFKIMERRTNFEIKIKARIKIIWSFIRYTN